MIVMQTPVKCLRIASSAPSHSYKISQHLLYKYIVKKKDDEVPISLKEISEHIENFTVTRLNCIYAVPVILEMVYSQAKH